MSAPAALVLASAAAAAAATAALFALSGSSAPGDFTAALAAASGDFSSGLVSSSSGLNGKRTPGCSASANTPTRLSKTGPMLRSPQTEALPRLKWRADRKYSHLPSGENAGELAS